MTTKKKYLNDKLHKIRLNAMRHKAQLNKEHIHAIQYL